MPAEGDAAGDDRRPELHPPDVDGASRAVADAVVIELLEHPPSARADALDAALARHGATDPRLRRLVVSLLAHADRLDAFLEDDDEDAPAGDEPALEAGQRIGVWRVVRPVGAGGMAEVFEAVRDDGVVRQRAALKLIRRGVDREAVRARFEAERQILAALDHPGIARLIDAGATSSGQPYFVMEFVEGLPIDAWCDARAASPSTRMRLIADVAAAVQYAHQRLIVHRDIKPGNILVTADGRPKLLDFGISKLLAPDDAAGDAPTLDAGAVMTPRFASPEQLAGTPISTASDVYSLGVVLFESLVGRSPYPPGATSLLDIVRAVATGEPARASTVARKAVAAATSGSDASAARAFLRLPRRARDDLDAILGKALVRRPADRYGSAAAFADDLARFLRGDPIQAVAPTWRYRARKFVDRHRVGVPVAALSLLAIVGLAAVATREAIRADRERDAAERRFQETRSLARTMVFELNDAIEKGPTQAREKLVRTALGYLDGLSRERLEPDLQRDVAAGYAAISNVLGNQSANHLGRTDEAKAALLKSLAVWQALLAREPGNAADLRGLMIAETDLGHLLRFGASPDEAALHFANATDAAVRVLAQDPTNFDDAVAVLARRRDEALIRFAPGRPSLHRYDEAVARYRALLVALDAEAARDRGAHVDAPRLAYLQQVVLSDLGVLERLGGNAAGALEVARRELAIGEAALAKSPDDLLLRRDLALATRHVGDSLLELGREREGLAMLDRSMALRRALADADPSNARAARDLAIGHSMLAFADDLAGRPRAALDEYRQWARLAEAALARNPGDAGHRLDLAQARWSMAEQSLALGDRAQALAQARQVEADLLAVDGETQPSDEGREALGRARLVVAGALAAGGSVDDALGVARRGLASLEANTRLVPEDAFASRDFARAQVDVGLLALRAAAAAHRPSDAAEACGLIVAGRDRLAGLAERRRLTAQFDRVVSRARAAAARCPTG